MASDYDFLPVSDGTGDAALMHITADRAVSSTVIDVDTTVKVPSKFIGTTGTLLATGYIDPATKTDFKGHIDTGTIVIDSFEPGSTDIGNTIGQVVIIKPNTGWANRVAQFVKNATNHGTPEAMTAASMTVSGANQDHGTDLSAIRAELQTNFIVSGCFWTADSAGSNLNGSMTSGVVYVAGKRLTVAAITAHAFAASKDTYVDFQDNGDGTALVAYTATASNNAASPALANSGTTANTLRAAIIVTGGSSIAAAASINQGEFDRALPAVSSNCLAVSDSIGNLIGNRNPRPIIIGYRQLTADFSSTATSTDTDVTGLDKVAFIAPGNRKVEAHFWAERVLTGATGNNVGIKLFEGATTLSQGNNSTGSNINSQVTVDAYEVPSAGLHTYKASINQGANAGTMRVGAAGPAFVAIKLV